MYSAYEVKKERLYQKAANILIGLIRQGRYQPGELLPAEREMSKLLNIGRSTLREALIVLELSGWVEIRSGSGIYVCEMQGRESLTLPSYEYSPHHVMQARQAVECELVTIVANSHTDKDVDILNMLVEEMDFCIRENRVADFYRSDRKFHLSLGEISANNILSEMNKIVWNRRVNIPYLNLDEPDSSLEELVLFNDDHKKIVQAIREGNGHNARSAMVNHLERITHFI